MPPHLLEPKYTITSSDRFNNPLPLASEWNAFAGWQAHSVTPNAPDGTFLKEHYGPALAMLGSGEITKENREGYMKDAVSLSLEAYQTRMILIAGDLIIRTIGNLGKDTFNNVLLRIFHAVPMDWETSNMTLMYETMTIGPARQVGPHMHGYMPSYTTSGRTVGSTMFAKSLNFESNVSLSPKGRAKMAKALAALAESFQQDIAIHLVRMLLSAPDPALALIHRKHMTIDNLMLPLTQAFAQYNICPPNFQERLITMGRRNVTRRGGRDPTIFIGTAVHNLGRNFGPGTMEAESGERGKRMLEADDENYMNSKRMRPAEIELYTDVEHTRHVLTQTTAMADFVVERPEVILPRSIGLYIAETDKVEYFTYATLIDAVFTLYGHGTAPGSAPGFKIHSGHDETTDNKVLQTGQHNCKSRYKRMHGRFAKMDSSGTKYVSVDKVIDLAETAFPTARLIRHIKEAKTVTDPESLLSKAASALGEGLSVFTDDAKVKALVLNLTQVALSNTDLTNRVATGSIAFNTLALKITAHMASALSRRDIASASAAGVDLQTMAFMKHVEVWTTTTTGIDKIVPADHIKSGDASAVEVTKSILRSAVDHINSADLHKALGVDGVIGAPYCAILNKAAAYAKNLKPDAATVLPLLVAIQQATIAAANHVGAGSLSGMNVNSFVVAKVAEQMINFPEDFKMNGTATGAAVVTEVANKAAVMDALVRRVFADFLCYMAENTEAKRLALTVARHTGLVHLDPLRTTIVKDADIIKKMLGNINFALHVNDEAATVGERIKQLVSLNVTGADLTIAAYVLSRPISAAGLKELDLDAIRLPYLFGIMATNQRISGDSNIMTTDDVGKMALTNLDLQAGSDDANFQKIFKFQMRMAGDVVDDKSVTRLSISAATDYEKKSNKMFFDNQHTSRKRRYTPLNLKNCEASLLPFLICFDEEIPTGWVTPMGVCWVFSNNGEKSVIESKIEDNAKEPFAFSTVILVNNFDEFGGVRDIITGSRDVNVNNSSTILAEPTYPFLCREHTVCMEIHGQSEPRKFLKDGWFPGDWLDGSMGLRELKKGNARHINDIKIVGN